MDYFLAYFLSPQPAYQNIGKKKPAASAAG